MGARRFFPVLVAVAAVAVAAAYDPPARAVDHPERLVSKRIRILSPDEYQKIRADWEAYTKAHPSDPMGWTELAKASRYAGVPCEEYIGFAEKAVRLDPAYANGLAALGSYRWCTYCPTEPCDPAEAMKLLEKALVFDPLSGEPHYTLWVMKLSRGDRAGTDAELRALLDGGSIPEPLVDLAHNLLVGLGPNAILLTNGDNDTYPPLALQAARGFRPDVAIVNLSLLNIDWYRESLRTGPWKVPVPEPPKDMKGMRSVAVLQGLIDTLDAANEQRPLYYAVTVALDYYPTPHVLSLEGVVYRALVEKGDERRVDGEALAKNMEDAYRLESATSLGIDWDEYSALRSLMLNYAVAYARLAEARNEGGDRDGARWTMERSMKLCQFHHLNESGEHLADAWAAWDPDSAEPGEWRARFQK